MKSLPILISILCAVGYQWPLRADTIEIRFAVPTAEDQPVHQAALSLADHLNTQLDGQVKVDVDTRDVDVLSPLIEGGIDLAVLPTGLLVQDIHNMIIFDLPFFFRDLEDVISLQDSYLGQAILGSVNETGLVGLAYWNNGLNRLFSHHPIENLSSLKQTQLWTQAVPSVHPTVLALGASPLSFSPQEGRAAITAGQIDTADLPVVLVASQPDAYSLKQVLDVGYRPEVAVLAANEAFWDALPYTLQVQIARMIHDFQDNVSYMTFSAEKEALTTLLNAGFEIYLVEGSDRGTFRAQTAEFWRLSVDQRMQPILEDARLILATAAIANPNGGQQSEWRPVTISFATDRSLVGSSTIHERFSNEFVDQLTYGIIDMELDVRSPIGSDHSDSYKAGNLFLVDDQRVWTQIEVSMNNIGRALVFVHGFNVSFLDAVLQAAVLAFDLKFDGPVIIFSWPSDGNVYRYSKDEETIQLSEAHFVDVVGKFPSLKNLERLYLISHSMGSRLVVESLATLILERQPGRVGVLELIFGAPDMNAKLFSMRMEKIAGVPARITLYASDNDMALHCARFVHGDYDRAGQEGEALVILPSVETVDTTELIPASQRAKYKQCLPGVMLAELSLAEEDFEHSYLFNDQRVVGDLAALIQNNRGAEARFRLEKVDSAKGSFHRMRP